MIRLTTFGLAALVAGGSVAAAPPPPSPPPPDKGTLIGKLFGPKPAPPGRVGPTTAATPTTGATPTTKAPAGSGSKRSITITEPLKPEVVADALRAEQEAYLRRVSVCTELRRVALERNDESLARQADELERQAAALYNARVASLGIARVKAPLPEPLANRNPLFGPLDEPMTTAEKANRLRPPTPPASATTTAQQIREVRQ